MTPSSRRPLGLAALLFAALLGCSSSAVQGGPGADVTLTTDAGKLRLHLVTTTSEPPVRGVNTFMLDVTDAASGSARDALSISVVPWMPVMGHGASVVPSVVAKGGGVYEIDEVDLPMPGQWQLRFSFAGPVSDGAEPTFDVQ